MNNTEVTTAARQRATERKAKRDALDPPAFPLQHQNQTPNDDLYHALTLLRVVGYQMEDGEDISGGIVHELHGVLCDALSILGQVQIYLDDLDSPTMTEDYQAARRRFILTSGGSRS